MLDSISLCVKLSNQQIESIYWTLFPKIDCLVIYQAELFQLKVAASPILLIAIINYISLHFNRSNAH